MQAKIKIQILQDLVIWLPWVGAGRYVSWWGDRRHKGAATKMHLTMAIILTTTMVLVKVGHLAPAQSTHHCPHLRENIEEKKCGSMGFTELDLQGWPPIRFFNVIEFVSFEKFVWIFLGGNLCSQKRKKWRKMFEFFLKYFLISFLEIFLFKMLFEFF